VVVVTRLADRDGFPSGQDARGRRCYIPAPGVHVYPVGHRHPISGAPRVCVRRLDGAAVFCDRAGRPLRRLPAGLAGADPELYLPFEELDPYSTNTASGSSALTMYWPASTTSEIFRSTQRLQSR
jgi:hypothetical protein